MLLVVWAAAGIVWGLGMKLEDKPLVSEFSRFFMRWLVSEFYITDFGTFWHLTIAFCIFLLLSTFSLQHQRRLLGGCIFQFPDIPVASETA